MPTTRTRRPRPTTFVESLEGRTLFAFGLTTTASTYTVDTNGGVVFSVLRQGTSSTIHSGDLTSFKFNGVEFAAPFSSTGRYSHFESGLSNSSAVTATVDPSVTPQWIKITIDDTTAVTGAGGTGVIQYYIAKRNDPNIYMATYAPEMKVSSTRFITYLDWNKFPYHPDESDGSGNTGGIETGDVQGFADGTTTSKYYGETRNVDQLYHGATGPAAGAFMFIGNRESGAGGPFWKDIDFQGTGAAVELYTMPYSGHSLTDTFRPGLHGPYALSLTNGSAPTTLPDYTFIDGVGLTGWVSPSARGTLSGRATGVASGRIPTVGLSNAAAQYWATPDAAGNYTISGIKPGTYTETLYEEELAVGTRTVTIAPGQATRADITATAFCGLNPSNGAFTAFNSAATPVWRIGNWDGTPREFLNGDKTTIMHPSDTRMSQWADSTGMTNFTVGKDPTNSFPMAEWHDQAGTDPFFVDTKNRITFNLTAAQRATALTLRIGVTRLDHGRPNVSANGGSSFATPNQTTQPDSRGVSLGNWRGNNSVYTFNFAANALRTGTNYIDISCVSGSAGTLYSGYHIYDAVDLIPTASASVPAVTNLTVSPGTATNIGLGGSRTFSALARDSGNVVRPANVVWSTNLGTINDAGEYTAPSSAGTATVTATYGSISSSVTINVLAGTPILATPAAASPSPAYYNSTTLSVLGSDDGGEAALKYTWSVVGTPAGPVTFGSTNGTNAAKSISATFTTSGTYTLQATIADVPGNTTVGQTTVVVKSEKAIYKFDQPNGQALAEYSGNGSFGTVYGSYAFPGGVSNGALQLKGGAAALASGVVAGLNDFTISTWAKPDALNNGARIFDFGTGTTSYMYLASRTSTAGNPIRFGITTSGTAGEQIVNGPTLANGVWTHLAITQSGNTATLYVNGVAAATNTGVTLRPSSLGTTTRNYLGDSQFAADPTFGGSIDEFRIYSRALAGSEITALATKPTVTTAAAASPAPVAGTTASLSVLGADALSGEAGLTYTWSLTGRYPGTVTLSANTSNAAKNTTATFTAAGTYNFLVTITNPNGLSTTSAVSVVVAQTVTSVTVTPSASTVNDGAQLTNTAIAYDQFGDPLTAQPTFTWSTVSDAAGGSLSAAGVYTAPANGGGPVTVRASTGSVSGTASFTVVDTVAPTLVSAASRKTHNSAGTFDLNLSLDAAAPSIESRSGGASTLVFTFAESVFAADGSIGANEFAITNGAFSSATLAGSVLTLNLSGVVDQARLAVGVSGLIDAAGNGLAGTNSLSVRNLRSDVDGTGSVNVIDQSRVKAALSQPVTSSNFLLDVNADGLINIIDQSITKSDLSHSA